MLKKHLGVRPSDISRPLNLRETIKYVTKQDQSSILINIPLKYTSTVYRARIYADQGKRKVNWSDYLPSQIAASERKVFEQLVATETVNRELHELSNRIGGINLYPWQRDVLTIVNEENTDRTVFWVQDTNGGVGKSILANHIVSCEGAALFHDMDVKNNSYMYQYEPVVIFDLPRLYVPTNMELIENLKNGEVNSTKYEPVKKRFPPPVVIVFSNHQPTLDHLSLDRWRVLRLERTIGDQVVVVKTWDRNDN